MTELEFNSRSNGNIGLLDRGIRAGAGLAIIFASLHMMIDGVDLSPMFKIFGATLVLTAIAGWDPVYAAYRTIASRISSAGNIVRHHATQS